MKREKRLKDYKTMSAPAKAGFGVSPKRRKELKREYRKKLRLANKSIEL